MESSVLGVIVAGGTALEGLADGGEAALTPFGGRHRFIDFAQASLANSGVTTTYVLADEPGRALARHLAATGTAKRLGRLRVPVLTLPPGPPTRVGRLLRALAASHPLAAKHQADTVVILMADHILRLDVRQLTAAHHRLDADLTLTALPVPLDEATRRTILHVEATGRVRDVTVHPEAPVHAPDNRAFALSWAGDVVVRAELLETLTGPRRRAGLHGLIESRRVLAHDILDDAPGRRSPGPAPYFHQPTTLEEYYVAQMELCTPHPPLDLSDPAWPMPTIASGLAAARVVTDESGRTGRALNALLSDGTLVRGATLVNAVVGPRVIVDSGAEVEDSILLEGCRIGRHARVRRTVVAAGAVIEDHAEIGCGSVAGAAQFLPSGLTFVPAAYAPPLATAAGVR